MDEPFSTSQDNQRGIEGVTSTSSKPNEANLDFIKDEPEDHFFSSYNQYGIKSVTGTLLKPNEATLARTSSFIKDEPEDVFFSSYNQYGIESVMSTLSKPNKATSARTSSFIKDEPEDAFFSSYNQQLVKAKQPSFNMPQHYFDQFGSQAERINQSQNSAPIAYRREDTAEAELTSPHPSLGSNPGQLEGPPTSATQKSLSQIQRMINDAINSQTRTLTGWRVQVLNAERISLVMKL
jgi:hypothetical protein